ncbi:MAG: M15 family metallopeptidase [Clostridium sp.]|nr:M15 family metallopeptidase [Clostridium sp.]MCM1208713.1 M15 family metallopeptidase [Ruminococcus sp.]
MNVKSFFLALGKKIKRAFKKIRRFFKKYVRLLIKHTKAGDYSILMYTIFALAAIILVVVLFANLLKPDKKEEKKESTATVTNATTEAVNPNLELSKEAKEIYERNKALLILVNHDNPLPEDYAFEQHTLNSGFIIDEQMYIDLYRFTKACNDTGLHYNIVAAYRDKEAQQGVVDRNIQELMDQGLSEEEARAKTSETVPMVGYSEHETGLAIDLSDEEHFSLTVELETNETVKWLTDNCYSYGFILRYPKDKVEVTGIDYEPWHFRYVGEEAAKFMYEHNLTLEEFYQLLGN